MKVRGIRVVWDEFTRSPQGRVQSSGWGRVWVLMVLDGLRVYSKIDFYLATRAQGVRMRENGDVCIAREVLAAWGWGSSSSSSRGIFVAATEVGQKRCQQLQH